MERQTASVPVVNGVLRLQKLEIADRLWPLKHANDNVVSEVRQLSANERLAGQDLSDWIEATAKSRTLFGAPSPQSFERGAKSRFTCPSEVITIGYVERLPDIGGDQRQNVQNDRIGPCFNKARRSNLCFAAEELRQIGVRRVEIQSDLETVPHQMFAIHQYR